MLLALLRLMGLGLGPNMAMLAAVLILASTAWFLGLHHRLPACGLTKTGGNQLEFTPVSVNYHFTRICNLSCGFCFHVSKDGFKADRNDAKRALRLLKDAGMRKINFAGGEPFLYPSFLGDMLLYCKQDLALESVSIVTNATKVTESFLQRFAPYIDIIAVSCDSFNEEVNRAIGRAEPNKPNNNVQQLRRVAEWCKQYGILFKINTVVCKFNWQEDLLDVIQELNPFRWKCFQVLLVEGENDSVAMHKKGDYDKFHITNEQFAAFCDKHKHLDCFVPESNTAMASSYLILDEHLRFLDKGPGYEKASDSILDVGVAAALSQIKFDQEQFIGRGGVYDWSKGDADGGGCATNDTGDVEDFTAL